MGHDHAHEGDFQFDGILMEQRYAEWIKEHVPSEPIQVRGSCGHWSGKMKEAFPELELQAGIYIPYGKVYNPDLDVQDKVFFGLNHWWLKAPDGSIVDPTFHQFVFEVDGQVGTYDFIPEDQRPIGKCMNCGNLCWRDSHSSMSCSPDCDEDLRREYA